MSRFPRFSVRIQRFCREYFGIFRFARVCVKSKIGLLKCVLIDDHVRGLYITPISIGVTVESVRLFKCSRCGKQFTVDFRLREDQFLVPRSSEYGTSPLEGVFTPQQLQLPYDPGVWTLPASGGNSGQVLTMDNSGNLQWGPVQGSTIYDVKEGRMKVYDGSNWKPIGYSSSYDPQRDVHQFKCGLQTIEISSADLEGDSKLIAENIRKQMQNHNAR